jgi:hypothetical protein
LVFNIKLLASVALSLNCRGLSDETQKILASVAVSLNCMGPPNETQSCKTVFWRCLFNPLRSSFIPLVKLSAFPWAIKGSS